jgi:hypothetical protein
MAAKKVYPFKPSGIALFCFLLFFSVVPGHMAAQVKINPEHAGHPDSLPEYPTEILRNSPDHVSKVTLVLYPVA